MRYEDIITWKDTDFKRLTGVLPKTFAKMLAVLEKERPNFGRPPKLSRADQLLMTLMYWREYRTQFHIADSCGISEATVCRTINKVKDALICSGEFRLPGKKVIQPSNTLTEIVLVDVSEQAIERPKKSKNAITAKGSSKMFSIIQNKGVLTIAISTLGTKRCFIGLRSIIRCRTKAKPIQLKR
ncbi:MAG: transposase family protein [Anaerolineales bacterium]|uniref:Transposase family protein n=1 Tax=Candidatus Desulfolinea nitratireducens TaxID=2841698 RepID=A0A8J6NMQ9_9CHLR|nr:transposase family protein [Candidatus Desulfolinea nitratireducens]MBL6959689.1 transposase family protein [Anaerolineales bacterium]